MTPPIFDSGSSHRRVDHFVFFVWRLTNCKLISMSARRELAKTKDEPERDDFSLRKEGQVEVATRMYLLNIQKIRGLLPLPLCFTALFSPSRGGWLWSTGRRSRPRDAGTSAHEFLANLTFFARHWNPDRITNWMDRGRSKYFTTTLNSQFNSIW